MGEMPVKLDVQQRVLRRADQHVGIGQYGRDEAGAGGNPGFVPFCASLRQRGAEQTLCQ
jgi:hypothetical protein